MKPLLLIFALSLICAGLPLGQASFLSKLQDLAEAHHETGQDWNQIDVNEAQSNPDIKANLDYGVQQFLQTLLNAKKITNTDYQLIKVNDVKKQNVGKAVNYQFQVDLNNGQGTSIKATFTVTYKPTGDRIFGSYNYSMATKIITTKSVEADENGWIEVSVSEIQSNSKIGDALQFAIDNSIKQAVDKGELSVAKYEIASIHKCYKQTVSGFTFYKYNVDLTNYQGTEITLTATVVINEKTGERTLRAYNYVATTTLYAERIKIINSNEGYTTVTTTEISSSIVKSAQNLGVQVIISAILGEGKITDSSFQVTKLVNCYKRVINEWTFYKFDVELKNSQGVIVTATFTVRCNNKSGALDIAGFTYKISGQKSTDGDDSNDSYVVVDVNDAQTDSDTKNILGYCVNQIVNKAVQQSQVSSSSTFKISKVNAIFKKIVVSGIYFKFDAELQDDEGTVLKFSCTVRYNIKTGQIDVLAYNYKIQQASQEPGQYTNIDVSQAQSNQEVQTVVNFAIGEVVKKISGKVSNLNFSVSKYISVQRSSNAKYAFYLCSLELTNGAGATVTTTFSVRLTLKTGACELTSFKYNLTNKKVSTSTESDESDESDEEDGAYVTVDESALTTDNNVKLCADFGIKEIIKKVLQKKAIENTDFAISKVISIQKKVTNNWIYCTFNVELSNGEGWTITTQFTVRCNAKSGQCTLKSYNYKYNYNANWSDSGDYSDLDADEFFEDENAETAANYAIEAIVKKFTDKTKLQFQNFQVENYNSGQRKATKNYIFYKFDLELRDTTGISLFITCSVKLNIKTKACELTAWNYRYTIKKISNDTESDVEDDEDEEEGTYNTVSENSLTTDKNVKTCADFGINEIIKKVLKKKSIENIDFTISRVISIKKKVTAHWTYCTFNLELTNGEGWTITTQFTVRCDIKSGKCTLKSYNYKYNYNANWSDSGDYSDLDADEFFEDENAETAANYAIEAIVKQFTDKTKLQFQNFQVENYNSGQRKATKNYIFYKFDLELRDTTGISLFITCSVKLNIKTKACELTAWNYKYTIKKISNDTESDLEDTDEDDGKYVEVSGDQLSTDKNVQLCASFGIQEVIKKVLKKQSGITNTDFQISQVISLKKKTKANWIYCTFNLELSNGEGSTITTKFTVRCDAKSGKCVLKSYHYKYNYNNNWADTGDYTDVDVKKIASDAQATTAANFGIKEIVSKFTAKAKVSFNNYYVQNYNSVQRKITKSYAFYKFDVEITNGGAYTIFATFTIKLTLATGKCELLAWNFRYSTKKISTEDESDLSDDDEEDGQYTQLDSSSVTNNQETKAAVNFGIAKISEKVSKKKGLSSSTFTISKVNSIKRKATLKWIYYRFDLILINNEGWTISCTFTIRCNAKNLDCSLKAYHYKVTYTEPAPAKLTESDVNNNADVKAAMDYGVGQVMNNLKSTGVISSFDFKVTKIEEGEIKRTKDGNYYTFNLELTGPYSFVVKISITVYHNPKTNTRSVTAWKLKGTSGLVSAAKAAVSKWFSW